MPIEPQLPGTRKVLRALFPPNGHLHYYLPRKVVYALISACFGGRFRPCLVGCVGIMYRRVFLALVVSVSWVTSTGAVEYTLNRLGLSDALHTRDDGYQYAVLNSFSMNGYAAGNSTAFKDNDEFGISGWRWDGQNMVRLGLFDIEHRSPGHSDRGAYYAEALFVNNSGVTLGRSKSYRYPGLPRDSIWLYDGQMTRRLGLLDAAHTGSNGQRESVIEGKWLNNAGDVLGYSRRYAGSDYTSPNTLTAWLYRDGEYKILGFTAPEFQDGSGLPDSHPKHLNQAGQATGYSVYGSGTYHGIASWISDGDTTTPIGLVTPDTLSTSYWSTSAPQWLNEAGQVVGHAQLGHVGGSLNGDVDAVWFFDGEASYRIGLYGEGYIYSPTNANWGRARGLSEAGHVIGTSRRWNGTVPMGNDAWIYREGVTKQIGLTTGIFQSETGVQDAFPLGVNDLGFVVGRSYVFESDTNVGSASWLYDGESSYRIGLFDAAHTSSSGKQNSRSSYLLPNGDVAGIADRYNGDEIRDGITLWYFDYSDLETDEITFIPSSYPHTTQGGLTDVGTGGELFGYAEELDANGFTTDWDVFTWTEATGRQSFLPFIQDGGDRNLFEWILYVSSNDSSGLLYGRGETHPNGSVPFVLFPTGNPDYNGDGTVNAADYTVWRNAKGQTVTRGSGADGSGPNGYPDGLVDQHDYAFWKARFGGVDNLGTGGTLSVSVPEPGSLTTHLATIVVLLGWRRVRRCCVSVHVP